MSRKLFKSKNNSLSIGLTFILITTLLIVGGVLLKFFLLLSASSFDNAHQYVLAVKDSDNKNALIDYDPNNLKITEIIATGPTASLNNALELPVDSSTQMQIQENFSTFSKDLLTKSKTDNNLTIIDKIRLFIFSYFLKDSDVKIIKTNLPIDPSLARQIPQIFQDKTLYNENESISVVNATGITGFGNKVARILGNVGANVVSVTSSDVNALSSLTTNHPDSYTMHQLKAFFTKNVIISSKPMIADITFVVGSDLLKRVQ